MVLKKFKKAAGKAIKKAQGQENLDRILAMPITDLRLEVKAAFQKKKFDEKDFDAFLEKLAKIQDIPEQVAIAREAVKNREVDDELDIELNTPAKQLLWAATLTRMMDDGKEPVERSRLWKQLQGTIGVHNEAIAVSKVIAAGLQDNEVTFDWGHPGSWFYHDPRKNHINLDLFFMLLTGFEHVRPIHSHEIGHSQLSHGYPPGMEELYEKVKAVVDPSTVNSGDTPPPKMTIDEQKKLARDVKAWNLWFRAWNSMEDLTVDQFSIDQRRKLPQDFGDSLNYAATVLRGYAEIVRGDDLKIDYDSFDEAIKKIGQVADDLPKPNTKEEKEAAKAAKEALKQKKEDLEKKKAAEKKRIEGLIKAVTSPFTDAEVKKIKAGDISVEAANKMYGMVTKASLLAGYEKNGLFSDKDENWEKFRVFKDDINRLIDVSALPDANGRDAFTYLVDLSAGNKGPSIRTLQPKPSDHLRIRDGHETIESSYRAVVAETTKQRGEIMQVIWDNFLKPYADVLINDYEQKLEESLKNKQQQNQQGDPQQGDGQPGDGDPQPGGGQGQPGDGDPQPGGGGGGEPQDMDDDLKNDIGDMSKDPGEGREKENEPENAGGGGDKPEDKPDDKPGDQGAGGGDGDKPEDKPKDGKNDKGQGGPGWDHDPPKEPQAPQKVGDLKDKSTVNEDMTEEQKQAMKDAAKNMQSGQGGLGVGAGQGRGVDLSALAKGDWKDFERRMNELAPVVNRVARAYQKIREQQRKQVMRASKSLDFAAEDGDIQGRLDRDKVLETKFRQATRQKMNEGDFKRFREDKTGTEESTIENVYMIDGSGSMPCVSLPGGVTAMEAALQSAAIGYMASRKAGIDSYIVIWGSEEPLIVATPDTPLKDVGQALEALRNGTHSGTNLAPGLTSMIDTMAGHKSRNGTISGSSHVLIFSDGDMFDSAASSNVLETVCANGKNLSIDVAVLRGDNRETSMEKLFQGVMDKTGSRLVGIVKGHDPNEIPLELSQLTLRRVRSFKIKSEPDRAKRKRLRSLHRKILGQ